MVAEMASPGNTRHIQNTRCMVTTGKKWFYSQPGNLNIKFYSAEGNFIFFIPPCCADAFAETCLEFGVMLRTGKVFGAAHGIRVRVVFQTCLADQGRFQMNCGFDNCLFRP